MISALFRLSIDGYLRDIAACNLLSAPNEMSNRTSS